MRAITGIASVAIVAVGLFAGLSALPDRASAAAGDVSIIALSCDTNPEYVRIKNFGGAAQSLSGFHIESDPSQDYTLSDLVSSIGAGQTLEFQSGNAAADSAGVYRMTGLSIYRNSDPTDYARLVRPGTTSDQVNCGDTPTTPTPVPSDADSDGIPDSTDNCPNWPNSLQSLPPWPIDNDDPDCDGFSTTKENAIGTEPLIQCPLAAGLPDAWPPDLTQNGGINITDVLELKPVFGTSVPPTSSRFDLSPSGAINITDVLELKPFFGQSCTP